MADLVSNRRCSSCKHHEAPAQFATASTCQTCAAKKEIRRRAKGQTKRRKGRADEGPEGTRWCSKQKWCAVSDFTATNATCDPCLAKQSRIRNGTENICNASGAPAIGGWEVEELVVQGSGPVGMVALPFDADFTDGSVGGSIMGCEAESSIDIQDQLGVVREQANASSPSQHPAAVVLPAEPPAAPAEHPLNISYTPEGTEPISDDVTSALDDVTRMMGQQLRLEAAGQLVNSSGSGLLLEETHILPEHASVEVQLYA